MAAGNNIVGEVGLKVVPVDPNAQFQAGVDQIIKRLEKQAQFQVQAAGLEQVQQQANQAGQAFANAAIQAAGLTAAIYGIRSAVEGAINKLSGLFDQLAQARAGFTSILKSEAAGGKLLDDIREFARVSPFVTQELVNYSQQLLGVGLAAKEIIPLLRSTGDIISSVGGDTQNLSRVLFTLTQIKSIGVLKGQDTMQLQNSLIPITKYLSEYLHKSAQEIIKLREAGLITADTVFNALNQQGEKVKGAMDAATRNIAGARAILTDTIIQLKQDQPVLNDIFEDTYKSIQALAERLGEADFQQAFNQFFDGVETVYNALKPLLSELAKIGDSGALTALKTFGSALSLVGQALEGLGPLLPLLARLIAAMAAIKAPLLLLQYATTFKTLAAGIVPASANLIKNTAATQAATQASAKHTLQLEAEAAAHAAVAGAANAATTAEVGTAAAKKGGIGASLRSKAGVAAIAATIGGQYLSGKEGTAAKTAGGALQGAGTGFLVAGVPGAIAGAAIGGLVSYFGAQDAALKKRIEEQKKKGAETAEAFIEANNKAFGTAPTASSYKAFGDEIDRLNAKMAPLIENEKLLEDIGFGDVKFPDLEGLRTELEAITSTNAATFDPINSALADLVANLDESTVAFDLFTETGREDRGQIFVVGIERAQEVLEHYGFTLDDLNSPERRELLAQYIPVFDHLTTAQQNATRAATELNSALKTARETISQLFDPIQTGISDQISELQLRTSVTTAAFAAGANKNDLTKQLEFQLATSKAAEDAQARQLAKDNILLKNLKERQALERQSSEGGLSAGELANRQADEVAAFNEAAAIRQAAAAKNEETRATLLLNAATQSASRTKFALSEAQIKQQEKLLNLDDTQKNRDIIANVKGTALQKIDEETKSLVANYDPRKKDADAIGRQIPTLDEFTAANKRRADIIAGVVAPATAYEHKLLKDVTDEIKRQTQAIADAVPPWQNFVDTINKTRVTGDLLGSLFKVNEDNLVALNTSAENLNNVFSQIAGQANTIYSAQIKDGATPLEAEAVAASNLWTNLELVQLTLGQTNEEFAVTLANAGLVQPALEGFSGTFAEVAAQLGVPEQVLADIVGLIGQIPTDLVIAITADGGAAITELNRIKALILSDPVLSTLLGGASAEDAAEIFGLKDGKAPEGSVAFGEAKKPVPGKTELDKTADKVKAATDALADKLQTAADSIAEAAKQWVHSIKERTQFESSISATRAISNTQKQIKEVVELAAGISELKARGLSDEAIKSLGIDNVSDLKQVRKLLKANPNDLTTLSAGVSELTKKSVDLATTQEDSRTRKNIAEGIIEAANTLGLDMSKGEATALAGSFEFNINSDPEAIASAILGFLTKGVSR